MNALEKVPKSLTGHQNTNSKQKISRFPGKNESVSHMHVKYKDIIQ